MSVDISKVGSRTIILSDDISRTSARNAIEEIAKINEQELHNASILKDYKIEPIRMIINTYGGNVHAGFALIGAIEMSQVPIEITALGAIMSMGLPIIAAGHYRIAHRYSTFMYHEVSTLNIGKIEEQRLGLEEAERLQKLTDKHLIEYTNLSEEKLTEIKQNRNDWFFTADEALEYGLVDEVISGPMIQLESEVSEELL